MSKIKYALIGFGGIAENRIAKEGFALDKERFVGHDAFELVGATDINRERQEAAQNLGLKWYADADAVCQDPDIDAVFITTNNLSHALLAKQALNAGKHCLVEKPLATTLADAKELQNLAREKGLSLDVDHMMVHNDLNGQAKDLINRGALGQVNDAVLHMEFLFGSTAAEAQTWRCADPLEIGGPIGDVASHCLYMAEFLFQDKVESLACTYTPSTLDLAVENGAFIQFHLANGMGGSIRVAFNQARGGMHSTFYNLGYEVYGDQAALRAYGTLFQFSGHEGEPIKMRLEIDKFNEIENYYVKNVKNIYQEQIKVHAQSILENKPMDGSNGVHNLQMVLACHESAKNGMQPQKIV